MMKEIFYIIGFVALCFVAYKVMSKVKDVPDEKLDHPTDEVADEIVEDEQSTETES